MVFASPVFLFIFFPVFLLVYRLLPARFRAYWLLAGSLFFYFWGEPVYVLLMAAAILVTWGTGFAVSALKGEYTPLLVHELDAPMLGDPDLNVSRYLLRRNITAPPATDLLQEGSRRTLAGLEIEVLHTPGGHTPGSVCYRIENELFTGDTLFEQGWGRTDFPGGDEHALFASLRRIMPIARTIPFHPGHET